MTQLNQFLRALRSLPESSWFQISRDLPSWEHWWDEEVGEHLTDQEYGDAVADAGLHDPDRLVRAIAEACSAERRAEADDHEEVSWLVMQAEIEQLAKGAGPISTAAIQQAGVLAFERLDWKRAVDAAIRGARAIVLGHRLSEHDSDFALSPLRHIVRIPDFLDLD
jgi:hypothetical protein